MKNKMKKLFYSDEIIILLGLIVAPGISFVLLLLAPESPLYASISRIAWVHNMWIITFCWAVLVMAIITWLTYRIARTGVLTSKQRKGFLLFEFISILLVFVGCLIFPAKESPDFITVPNYIHDYLTAAAWLLYALGLIYYSLITRKKDKFLGNLGMALMGFIVISSVFFLYNVIDPASYVGASAISEVYIINSLLIYLVVMYVAQKHLNCAKATKT